MSKFQDADNLALCFFILKTNDKELSHEFHLSAFLTKEEKEKRDWSTMPRLHNYTEGKCLESSVDKEQKGRQTK